MIAGGVAGWLYWKYLGCTGSCLITSKPLNSSLYGALVGGLLFNIIAASVYNKSQSRKKDNHD